MRRILPCLTGVIALAATLLTAQSPVVYAIQGARIVPVAGPAIDNGTIVFRNGLIAAVGASIVVPPGAEIIDGKGLTVYPGLIDMGSTTGLAPPAVPRADNPRTTEDVERVKAGYLLRAGLRAADLVDPTKPALAAAAAAGITAILATPPGDGIRGQSVLITSAVGPDDPQIGAVADDRKGAMVLRTPVALHITFSPRPAGGNSYPNSLMGVIAFVRQTFSDAQYYAKVAASGAPMRPSYEPALDALQPALAGRLPVAIEGDSAREILRALDMARAFSLDLIVTGGREAGQVAADLKSANARVILSLNYPTRSQALAPDADEPLATLKARADAPKTAAALARAGVVFAFASDGLEAPVSFLKNAAKAVQQGLPSDTALRALTLQAATIAGAAGRVGSLEAGKLANAIVTAGDLFDEKTTIKYVFVEGRPVNLDVPSPTAGRRGQ